MEQEIVQIPISQDYGLQYKQIYLPYDQIKEQDDPFNTLAKSVILNTPPSSKFMDLNEPSSERLQNKFMENIIALYQCVNKQEFDSTLTAQRKEFQEFHISLIEATVGTDDYKLSAKFAPGFPHNPRFHDPFKRLIIIMQKLRKTPYYKDLTFIEKLSALLDPNFLFLASKPHIQVSAITDKKSEIKAKYERLRLMGQLAKNKSDGDPAYLARIQQKIDKLDAKLKQFSEGDLKQIQIKKNVFSSNAIEQISSFSMSSSSRGFNKRIKLAQQMQEDQPNPINRSLLDVKSVNARVSLNTRRAIFQNSFQTNLVLQSPLSFPDLMKEIQKEQYNKFRDQTGILKIQREIMQVFKFLPPAEYNAELRQIFSLEQLASWFQIKKQNIEKFPFFAMFDKIKRSQVFDKPSMIIKMEEYFIQSILMQYFLSEPIDPELKQLQITEFVLLLPVDLNSQAQQEQNRQLSQLPEGFEIVYPIDQQDDINQAFHQSMPMDQNIDYSQQFIPAND